MSPPKVMVQFNPPWEVLGGGQLGDDHFGVNGVEVGGLSQQRPWRAAALPGPCSVSPVMLCLAMVNQEAVTRYQADAGAEKQASQEPGA